MLNKQEISARADARPTAAVRMMLTIFNFLRMGGVRRVDLSTVENTIYMRFTNNGLLSIFNRFVEIDKSVFWGRQA
jgi:hypothetical protein